MKTALLLLLTGCMPATYNAGVRRMAEYRLMVCRRDAACYLETRNYCRSRGLENTCGEGVTQ